MNIFINYEPLEIEKIVFSAIDFHCYPKIIDILSDKYKEISKDDLKKTMWLLDSSYTNKKLENQLYNITEKYINIWSKIENYTQKIRSQFIKNMLNKR